MLIISRCFLIIPSDWIGGQAPFIPLFIVIRQVISFVGDGSYLLHNSDIYSSVLYDQKLIIVVCDNGGHMVINRLQLAKGGKEYICNLRAARATNLQFVDFENHARSLGANAETVSSTSELEAAYKRAKQSDKTYVMTMTNLRTEYRSDQTARLRVYAREKNWSPNIYTTANSTPENLIITSGSYRLLRITDELEVLPYGTGSVKFSELSYDVSGNYFDLDMSLLEPGYQYGFKFSIYDDFTQTYVEQPYLFKFRVIK